MKKIATITLFAIVTVCFSHAQAPFVAQDSSQIVQTLGSKIGIVIYSNDEETVWNAFRFANFACQKGDSVSVFLLRKGVEAEILKGKKFDVMGMMEAYANHGGKIFACGSCLQSRKKGGTVLCPASTMNDMYEVVKQSDKLLTF